MTVIAPEHFGAADGTRLPQEAKELYAIASEWIAIANQAQEERLPGRADGYRAIASVALQHADSMAGFDQITN